MQSVLPNTFSMSDAVKSSIPIHALLRNAPAMTLLEGWFIRECNHSTFVIVILFNGPNFLAPCTVATMGSECGACVAWDNVGFFSSGEFERSA